MKRYFIVLAIWILATVAVAFIKSNEYPIVDSGKDYLIVDRKGELVTFTNVSPGYDYNGSVRIYMDFDWAFREYNPKIK